jgi:hypothetical protein
MNIVWNISLLTVFLLFSKTLISPPVSAQTHFFECINNLVAFDS